jgi:hypothetical protein
MQSIFQISSWIQHPSEHKLNHECKKEMVEMRGHLKKNAELACSLKGSAKNASI